MIKKIKIEAWKKGIEMKNGDFVRLLNEGTYWLSMNSEVVLYAMDKIFVAPINLNILLKDESIVNAVDLIEVKANEVALLFENEQLKTVLHPGTHAYWKGLLTLETIIVNVNELQIHTRIEKYLYQNREIKELMRTFEVEIGSNAILYVDSKFEKVLEAGTYYFWQNSTSISIDKVDIRATQMEIAGQEILTKDKAAIRVNFFLQYIITDIKVALINNKEFQKLLYVSAQLILREYIGSLTFDEMFEKKDEISSFVKENISETAVNLGVTINSCGIRDIILPGDMKEIMNQVLIAEKKAQANTIMRREETASTRSLLNSAKMMEENAMLFKLKEMEYVEKIAEKINSISISGGGQLFEQMKNMFTT